MIHVEREDPELSRGSGCFENCCFCRKPTAFWCREKDVPVCLQCAEVADIEDVPDKQTWCRREDIAEGSDALDVIASGIVRKLDSRYEAQ